MIPISLKVEGLYSYKEAQHIDFEKLTASQLFGIFGAVGCGKSSILEAIMFALYDRSDRLNRSGDNRYYNMLNLQSNKLEIDFVFRTQHHSDTPYRFCFAAKRKKNDFEKVEVQQRCQYRWEQEQWMPIQVEDASGILGMTYENFMQAVIIPQGKFREFIDQKPLARTQMLKELFHLEKFDLGFKTGSLLKKTEFAMADIQARLGEIGPVSAEDIAMHQAELKELEESLHHNRHLLDKLESQCHQWEQLKKLFNEIEAARQQWHRLQDQQEDYARKEQQLHAYLKACTHFNEKLKLWSETLTEKRQRTEALSTLHERLATGQNKLEEAQRLFKEKQQAYAQRDRDQQRCEDLERTIHLRSLQADLKNQERVVQEEVRAVEKLSQNLQAHKTLLYEKETQLASLDQNLAQQQVLSEVRYWHQTQQELTLELNDHCQSLVRHQEQLEVITRKKYAMISPYAWAKENGTFEKFYQLLDAQRQRVKTSQAQTREAWRNLQVKEKLISYALNLKEGAPCPLCGATHHPSVAQVHSVAQQISQQRSKVEDLEQEEETLLRLEQSVRALESEYQSVSSVFRDKEAMIKRLEEKHEQHQQAFAWKDYRQQTYEQIRQAASQYEKQQSQSVQLKKHIGTLRQQYEQQEAQWTQAQHQLQQHKEAYLTLKMAAEHQLTSLRVLKYDKLAPFSDKDLQRQLQKGKENLLIVQQEYEAARQSCTDIDRTLGILEGRREAMQATLDELAAKADMLDEEIQALCTEKKFDSVQQVKDLLDLELDTDAEQQDILTYKTNGTTQKLPCISSKRRCKAKPMTNRPTGKPSIPARR